PPHPTFNRLWHLCPSLSWRIWHVLVSGGRERVRADGRRPWPPDDPHRHQVLQAVIANTDDLVRLGRHPFEFRAAHVRVFALTVTSPEPRRAPRRGLRRQFRC